MSKPCIMCAGSGVCKSCSGTGKDTPLKISQAFMEMLLGNIVVCHKLQSYTDVELAKILSSEVYAELPLYSRESEIVSEAVERLQRSTNQENYAEIVSDLP